VGNNSPFQLQSSIKGQGREKKKKNKGGEEGKEKGRKDGGDTASPCLWSKKKHMKNRHLKTCETGLQAQATK
jgi:hypothetical protein